MFQKGTKILARAVVVAFLVLVMAGQLLPAVAQQGVTFNTLRIYGNANEGAGLPTAADPQTGLLPEDLPYSEADAPFWPQHDQAPIKDHVTWNPIWMYENQTFDENQAQLLYNKIFAGGINASEKVWFREWYEPDHWDKDLNANGELDDTDEHYPAIMQEFTYLLMEPQFIESKPEPMWGRVGQGTSFVFPIAMRAEDLFDRSGFIDTTSENAEFGYGLTSLDGDFDGVSDIVHIESEITLFDYTSIAADLNGSGVLEPLDLDGIPLNGNEMAVLRLDVKAIPRGGYVQFLDHAVYVNEIFDDGAQLDIWYLGDVLPHRFNRGVTLFSGDMALAGSDGPAQNISAVRNGGPGTNMCDFPTGPWFVWVSSVDTVEETVRLMVGRAVGATYTAMEAAPGASDRMPGDPWFIKRFYVDGHEYNVTAIHTRNGNDEVFPNACNLDMNGDGVIDAFPPLDPTEFQYITLRTPIPKIPVLIEQHSVNLQHYEPFDYLSVLPPYNYEHYILGDIQAIEAFTPEAYPPDDEDYIGPLIGPVAPILQKNGPFPYEVDTGGRQTSYSDIRELYHFYVRELVNPQYTGQLLELYGEYDEQGTDVEFWYAQRFHTMPDHYTEFVFPDIRESITGPDDPDLYLLTGAFDAPQAEYARWAQTEPVTYENWVGDRVKFWFDPATGGKKYKDELGVRIYGQTQNTAGDLTATDPENAAYPVEVPPYTDPWAVFNPQEDQAPVKDILTFNPIYMYEYDHGREPLSGLYHSISIEERNAAEKVFFRMWYEPEYVDKILRGTSITETTDAYIFPALQQEFTYMFLDTTGQPSHGQPGNSHFIFPISTDADKLPAPVDEAVDVNLPAGLLRSFGYGLTSFDANWDGRDDIVTIHSENSLWGKTGIAADFDGNGNIDQLMTAEGLGGPPLNGEELVIFAVESITLRRGQSAQFLDHMVSFQNAVDSDRGWFKFWYTGGGLHPNGGEYWLYPDEIRSMEIQRGNMAVVNRTQVRQLTPLTPPGQTNGAWFMWVEAINSVGTSRETVNITIGRALGGAHSAIDNGAAQHDLEQGDPWYLKRFFVDGHEYNVVAIRVVPADQILQGDEDWEFKFITIRTPVPKQNFVNYQDSQKLEGYFLGDVLGVDSDVISVMPPFNYEHTVFADIEDFQDEDCVGDLLYNRPPMEIVITEEEREPQFFGELREILYLDEGTSALYPEIWSIEQFNTLPDRYTELRLPPGELYLLTLDWMSDENEDLIYETCDITVTLPLSTTNPRVQFWYDPTDPFDIYVNDEVAECLPVMIQGVVYPYSGPCQATHYLLLDSGATIYVMDDTGILSNYNGMLVMIDGCLYDTVTCEPGVQVGDPGNIIPMGPLTPTPTATRPATNTPTITPTPTRTSTQAVTPTPTATGQVGPTQTPLPGYGHVSGIVQVEGRVDYAGASVSIPGVPGANTMTNASGKFTLYNVPVGMHTIVGDISRYLYAQKSDVNVVNGVTTMLPDVNLRGGDANDDDTVDIFDLVILGLSYNSTPVDPDWDARGDINNDGAVNLWDLVLVGTNYNKTAPTDWSLLAAPKSAAMMIPAKAELNVQDLGSDLLLEVKVADATELYGAEIELDFDALSLQVQDADPNREGVQVAMGDLFAADGAYVIENSVDNAQGVIRFAVTMLRPAEPVSGEGVLIRIRFDAQGSRKTIINMSELSLYSKAAQDMQVLSDKLFVELPELDLGKVSLGGIR